MMLTNVDALKGLYVALGGDASEVANLTTTPELLAKISVVAGAGASELPVVKKADAGKTLTVNSSGKWSAIMPADVIDDSEASETTTYSSSKINSLIPADELPAVTNADAGKVLTVNSNGTWSAGGATLPAVSATDNGKVLLVSEGAWTVADIPASNT